MRRKRIFGVIVIGLVILLFGLIPLTDSGYLWKALRYNFTDIDDYKLFPHRTLTASPKPQPWPLSSTYNQATLSKVLKNKLEELNSVAFLVIKSDSIIYEHYWEGYDTIPYSNSFSMAKSVVSACIGIAIEKGHIKSVSEPIANYIPEFKGKPLGATPILHFLMMSSGSSWNESYANPFSVTTKAYYGTDLKKIVLSLEKSGVSGRIWEYKSGDTQVLAYVLQQATGMPLAKYVEQNLWHPMGATHDALWSLDREGGLEKAYCCLNTNARNFARFGQLYLDTGAWKGQQLVPRAWVKNSILPNKLQDKEGLTVDWYGWQWWVLPDLDGHRIYYSRGIGGQYIFCIPDEDMVVVRLGHKRGSKPEGSKHPHEVPIYLREAMRLF